MIDKTGKKQLDCYLIQRIFLSFEFILRLFQIFDICFKKKISITVIVIIVNVGN